MWLTSPDGVNVHLIHVSTDRNHLIRTHFVGVIFSYLLFLSIIHHLRCGNVCLTDTNGAPSGFPITITSPLNTWTLCALWAKTENRIFCVQTARFLAFLYFGVSPYVLNRFDSNIPLSVTVITLCFDIIHNGGGAYLVDLSLYYIMCHS